MDDQDDFTHMTPHLALRLAVLVRAISDFHGIGADRKDRREAICWFEINDRSHEFSFLNICSALDIDPSYIRSTILPNRDYNTVGTNITSAVVKIFDLADDETIYAAGRAPRQSQLVAKTGT